MPAVCDLFPHSVAQAPQNEKLADGTYQADVTLTGGSGRATVDSPAAITVKDGKIYATIVWSSRIMIT